MSQQQQKQFFTPEEDAVLREKYPTYTAKEIQRQFLPDRNVGSIQARAGYLGVKKESLVFEQEAMGQRWTKRYFTPEEDAIIREMYPTHTAKEIQQLLPYKRSTGPIQTRAKTLGVVKQETEKQEITKQEQRWTKRFFAPEEDAIIREYYAILRAKEIQQRFLPDRSVGSIQSRAINLGIKKDYTPSVEDILDQTIIEVPNYKKCTKCEKIKSKKCFHRDRTRPDGLQPYCKLCNSTRALGIKREHGKEKEAIAEGHKRCTICEKVKLLEQFYRNRKAKDGRWPRCKVCDDARKERSYEARYLEMIKTTYGLTPDDYRAMLEKQNSVCACCGQPETAVNNGKVRALAVDHCHTTGAVRGLLCAACNSSLGMLGEDPERVKALLKYIEERCLW
jgi:Recombination endonuclease VII